MSVSNKKETNLKDYLKDVKEDTLFNHNTTGIQNGTSSIDWSRNNNVATGIDWSANNQPYNQPYTTGTNIGATRSWDFSLDFHVGSDDLAINVEKLFTYEEKKREVLKDILKDFINEADKNIKRLLFNTLQSYGLLVDKEMLVRKVKISNSLEVEEK